MCWFVIVIKLLILKIFLAGLTAARYDYGYHPSAEEFDNLLRETRRTWTHSLLKTERDRDLFKHQQEPRTDAKYFVPKFNYESVEKKFLQIPHKNPFIKHHDLQAAASSSNKNDFPVQNIGSTLDFTFFHDEIPKPFYNDNESEIKNQLSRQPTAATTLKTPSSSAWPEINLKPIAKPDIPATTNHKYSLNNLYNNNTQAHFPIYFTNPATGIVYSITEMGKSQQNVSKTNGSIPIFITKEQYEQEIWQLKQEFENNCLQNHKKYHITSLSRPTIPTTATTTTRPQIIKLQKPHSSSNFSSTHNKPLPVVVKTELIVKDKRPNTVTRPLRKKKHKTKNKKKLKKSKPPGRKPIFTTNQSVGPKIVLGSRITTQKPMVNNEKLSTQLEKPNFDSTTFSSHSPLIQTNNPNFYNNNHRINKRSIIHKLRNLTTENTDSPEIWSTTNRNLYQRLNTTNSYNKTLIKSTNQNQMKLLIEILLSNTTSYNLPKNLTNFNNENMFKDSTNFPKEHFLKYTTEMLLNSPNFNNRILTNFENSFGDNFKNQKTQRLQKRSVSNLTPPKFLRKSKHSTTQSLLGNNNNSFSVNNSISTTNLKNYNHSLSENKTSTNNENGIELLNLKKSNSSLLRIKSSGDKKKYRNSRNRTNVLRKRKLAHKQLINLEQISNSPLNNNHSTNNTKSKNIDSTTPRTIKRGLNKLAYRIVHNKGRKPPQKTHKDAEYGLFDFEGDDDDDDDYESDEDDEEYDDVKEAVSEINDKEEDKDYDQHSSLLTSEAGLSVEDLQEKNTHENSSSAEEEADFGALEEQFDYKKHDPSYEPPNVSVNKRIRRRPEQLKAVEDEDYEDDDIEENSISSNLGDFFRMIFYPVQVAMGGVMDTFMTKDSEEEPLNPYMQYTSYHNTLKQHSSDEYYDDYDSSELTDSSLSSWLSSLFGFNRRNKKIGSTTAAPVASKPAESPSWLQSWFGIGANDRISTETASTEDYSDYDKWFASWFGETKPKARKRTTTTTTSTTTQIPHVPILTIVDPMRNPQNWIGILAHHIINHTSFSTQSPLKDMWGKVTSTTSENSEIPRRITYDKYQIWRLKPQDDTQVRALQEYKKSEDGIKLQWLKGPSLRGLTDVLVPPKMLVDFQASLTFELIDHEVLIFDVGKAIAYEKSKEDYYFTTTRNPHKKHQNKHPPPSAMTWHKYNEYDDIIKYLETMRMRFPQLVELMHIGRSFEGRPLIVMKIESKQAAAVNSAQYGGHQKTKLRNKKRIGLANAVFIEAGTHGMEWIGPATATWIINELLKIMKKNSTDDQSFIRNTTWYIMPVLNPDGYVYSHKYDRFWKKSRSRHVSRPSGIINSAMTWLQKKRTREKVCFGVDLDHNWHYQWGKRGSSKSPCNEFYAGPVAFSEPETKALSEFLMDYRTQIKLFISMQAYGQIISYPYRANTTYDSERLDDLFDVAMVGTDGLRKKGSKSRYKIDSSNDLVENRSGSSDAFAAYEAGIPFSYTIQLADNGVHGFLLPSASIESAAKDSFEIITEMLDYI